jgi:UDP-N-acetylglucosamine acyltransferase
VAGDNPMKFEGLNIIGLKRRGFTSEQIDGIKEFYKLLYKSGLNISDAIQNIKQILPKTEEVNNILSFISRGTRGILTDK